jgi:hypothetical protein
MLFVCIGNLLNGRLPDIANDSMLTDLTAANNILTGTIPLSIQHHAFDDLDLANNRFQGVLSQDFSLTSAQKSLTLAVNRLSGPLPNSFKHFYSSNLTKLDILSSNIFACRSEEIPKQDQYSNNYSCDSSELNVATYVWLGAALFTGLLLLAFYAVSLCFPQTKLALITSFKALLSDLVRWKSIARCIMQQSRSENSKDITKLIEHGVNYAIIPQDTLIELNAYFIAMKILIRWTAFSGGLILFVIIPTYCAMSWYYSIVTHEYAYTLSVAFLHGIAPTIFIGLIIALILSFVAFLLNIFYSIFTSILGPGESPSKTATSVMFRVKKYAISIVLHSINITVTLVVNILYVNAILDDKNITQTGFFVIQICLGTFKIIWNAIYIPWCSNWLRPFMSQSRNMQNRLIMSITNFIVAPCLATLAVNQSCFYFVIKSSPPSTTSINFHVCTFPAVCSDGVCCGNYENILFSTTSSKSFQYSYACGTALIVSYSPVLLYSYISYGFLLPILRYLRARYAKAFAQLHARLFQDEDDILGRVRGVEIIMSMKLHITVLLTFGLASSILGMVIVLAILTDCFSSILLAGRYLAVNYPFSSQTQQIVSMNPLQPSVFRPDQTGSSDIGSYSDQSVYRSRATSRLIEQRVFDLKDSWRGLFASYTIVILTVSIFWALMFFDMISDGSGVFSGVITSILFGGISCMFAVAIYHFQKLIDTRFAQITGIENRLRKVFKMDSLIVSSSYAINASTTVSQIKETKKSIEMMASEFS